MRECVAEEVGGSQPQGKRGETIYSEMDTLCSKAERPEFLTNLEY
jgi:hypothetical protein